MTDMLRPPRDVIKTGSAKTSRKEMVSPLPKSKKGGGSGHKSNGKGHSDAVISPVPVVARGAGEGETRARREFLAALTALTKGDFSARLPMGLGGLDGKIAEAFNDAIELNQKLAQEFERLGRGGGTEGRISERARIGSVSGAWAQEISSVNALISDLVHPTSETARVIGAVAKGDLSQTMALEIEGRPLQGEFLRTAKTAKTMVDQISSFASEVTRVAREVGTEGKLG